MKHLLLTLVLVLPAGLVAADERHPVVLQPGKYSYTFNVPKGWEASFDQAARFGVRLVFFPKGGNFADSNTIVYINEICKAGCGGRLKAAIEQTLGNAIKDSPALKVETAASLRTFSGAAVPVRILSGARDPRQAREALSFIDTESVVVLVYAND
jgi:hypothetical protein